MQMQDTTSLAVPPATQLRPLHALHVEQDELLSPGPDLSWTSSLGFRPSESEVQDAYLRLVSRIVTDPDETFCIQDVARNGYIIAHRDGDVTNNSFVRHDGRPDGIPTDFSMGPGKALQLHITTDGQVKLVAQANVVPQVGLSALGKALEDILVTSRNVKASEGSPMAWSQPSVLNWPPRERPIERKALEDILVTSRNVKASEGSPMAWSQPSVLNWPPRERPIELWPGDNSSRKEQAFLHNWFEQRVKNHPQRIALDFLSDLETQERQQYTYQQVSNAATALAVKLYNYSSSMRASGILRTVAVAMDPCPELYIGYLAVLKAGFAFCPIPVDAPEERRNALLADLEPVAIIVGQATPDDLLSALRASCKTVIDVGPFVEACEVEPTRPVLPSDTSTSEMDAAYILYTSGTTGMPKGVIVSHLSAACTISALSHHYDFPVYPPSAHRDRQVRWFQGAAPTFDISLFEIFWTLSTGSTLCCALRHLTMQNIDRVISVLQADITNVTPSFASLINPDLLTGLMVGGETLNTRLLHDFSCHNPPVQDKQYRSLDIPKGIYNGYGPTEATIYSLAQRHVPFQQRGSIIGLPLATCGALIVDTNDRGRLQPVPLGCTGELVLTGPQVSRRGYLHRPEETAKSFVDDDQWGRAYRTGDRARIVWDEDGEPVVEFLGRISDAQVKLSGRRVELEEIENVLASKTRGVQQTLACVWKPRADSTLGSERVVNLVVVDSKSGLDFSEVQAECVQAANRYLPDYMRPFRILEVHSLPHTTSGKLDRKSAAQYVRSMLHRETGHFGIKGLGTEFIEPLTNAEDAKVEAKLVEIVSGIVATDDGHGITSVVTATTKLADIGFDSLRAMRLLRHIRDKWPDSNSPRYQPSLALLLNPESSIRSVFFPSEVVGPSSDMKAEAQKKLTSFASRHITKSLENLGNEVELSDVETVLPATSTQSQLAVSFAMDRRNYISHAVLPLRAGVSAAVLKMAVLAVLERQAIYRSAIVPCSDDVSPFALVVLKQSAWRRFVTGSPRVVSRHAESGATAGDMTQTCLELAEEQLDLDAQKLYYVQIIESPVERDSKSLMVISIAHCICDGASVDVLLSDIAREYAGLTPTKRLSVLEAVLDWASGVNVETDRHWKESLQGWEVDSFHALSGGNVKSSSSSLDHGHGLVQFSSEVPWQQHEAQSRSIGASPLATLQAAWTLLLKIFSEANTEEIVFGSVLSGQHMAAHSPTFSVVPCRVALPERQTVRELLDSLANSSRFAQSHRNISFGLFDALPYNTVLALQAYSPPPTDTDTVEEVLETPWVSVELPAIRYDFDIFVEVLPRDQTGNMLYKLTYRDDALSETSARVIVQQFAALTGALLASKGNDLAQGVPAQLPRSLLSIEGKIPTLTDESVGQEGQKRDRVDILHAQFEEQAAATPDRLALSFYSALDAAPVNLTYAKLDARANGLANILRLEDADVIPICMHRSVELYVAILAILKAGSAWSPIDETSPVQRRTSLIARTQGKVLLTTTSSYTVVEPCLAHESLAGVRVIFVDQYKDHVTSVRPVPRQSVLTTNTGITGQNLAYLLWTSGTTGEPKGVMIQHYAAANVMRDLQVRVEHDKSVGQVRTLQLSAYSFDVFVQDLFYTWGLAGSVISGTRELVLGTFSEFVNVSQPTHAHLTPSFGASINVEEIAGSTLRFVTFIGEKLTEDVAEAWAAPEITTKAYNTYGPAENAVVSTMRQFYGKSRDPAKAANVGFPLTPCTAYVVREVATEEAEIKHWQLVPRYGVGELALGGSQVAKGYLNNEAKTTKSFILGGPGIDERIYLTGDMVRLNDHGFEFLGRNDDLVKITGIRIELSEISAACALVKDDNPAVEHVETLYLQRPGGDANHRVIVSFVSVKQTSTSSDGVATRKVRQQVFRKAREVLPAYMVPGHVAVLETTMPRTASNKVDRKALQAIYESADLNELAGRHDLQAEAGSASPFESGIDGFEIKWSDEQLLVIEGIVTHLSMPLESLHTLHPQDSLAGLGFSSLQVTKLAWALRRHMACSVGVLDLMRCETMGDLVSVIQASLKSNDSMKDRGTAATKLGGMQEESTKDGVAVVSWVATLRDVLTRHIQGPARPDNTSYILPATPVQESLLVETMIEPGAYWSHRLFDLRGMKEVDTARLKAAWTAAADRLDILRTVFVSLSQMSVIGTPSSSATTVEWAQSQGIYSTLLQIVLDSPGIQWTELGGSEDDSPALAALAQKTQMDLTPLGGSARPPWAVAFSPTSKTIMLSMHHSLYDEESSAILLDVVTNLYREPEVSIASDAALPLSRGIELGLLPTIVQRDEASAAWAKHLHSLVEVDGALNAPFPDLTESRQTQERAIRLAKTSIPNEFLELQQTQSAGRPDLPRLMQSAFGCVLAAVLELKTIVLGQAVSQRILHPDLSHVVGPAMATLPVVIRTQSSSAQALWRDMACDASTLGAQAHHLHPVDIKRIINEGSSDAHAPFPALFVYHPVSDSSENSGTARHSMFGEVGQALSLHVEHPMALNIFEANHTIELTGDARRISQPMLELILAQILGQARVMLAHPDDVPLPEMNNLLDRELTSIVGEPMTLVGTKIAINPADLVTRQAADHPDWVAIEEIFLDDDNDDGYASDGITTKTLTYGELEVLVHAIASQLSRYAVAPDEVVALYLERDAKSLAAILAIFRCSFVYLPIDGDLPAARKQLLVQDANAKLVVTTKSLATDLNLDPNGSNSQPPVFLLPEGNDELEIIRSWYSAPSSAALLATSSAGAAGGYLLYTSGSTGHPKGVRVTNENLLHFVAAMTQRLTEANPDMTRLGGVGKFLNVASRAFDTHLTTMFSPWYLGFRSAIGKDRNGIFANLQQVINALQITNMGTVPSVLLQLGLRLADVPSIRVLTFGGEKASHALFEQLKAGDPGTAPLMNFYGPTEAAVGCLSHVVGHHSNARNLGLPLPGLEAMLLASSDGDRQVVARRGQPGEFCIAGPQVAVGYLDRPEENARSFQTTTLLGNETKRIYRTGDIMRMMHDGTVEFLGRRDQQTKIRGQRFEIGEVEAHIKKALANEGPLDVAAVVVNQRLVGLLARKATSLLRAEREAEPELLSPPPSQAFQSIISAVEQACQQGLPSFMVPEMLWLSKIPYLTSSGKLDTKRIIELVKNADNPQDVSPLSAFLPPSSTSTLSSSLTKSEMEVVAALKEVLGNHISASASNHIRMLGIDSLSGVHLLYVLKRRGFAKVSLADLLSPSCTLASLAQKFDAAGTGIIADNSTTSHLAVELSLQDLGPSAGNLDPANIAAILPCLPLQASLVSLSLIWLLEEEEERGSSDVPYVTLFNYQLAPGTNVARWKAAAEQVASSEAILRTCFVQREEDGQVFQVILTDSPSPFDGEDHNAAVLVSHMSTRPPVRLRIDDDQVSLTVHHALYDGVAIGLLRRKIEQAYLHSTVSNEEYLSSGSQSLATLRSLSNHCNLSADQMQSVKAAWQENLNGLAPCRVDRNFNQVLVASSPVPPFVARVSRRLAFSTSELKEKLQKFAVGTGQTYISVSTAFQLAMALCVAHVAGSNHSIIYGFTMSLRPLLAHVAVDVDRFVGPCLNTVVHALALEGAGETLSHLAARVDQNHTKVCQGNMPLVATDKVQRWAGIEEKLFDSLLTINVVDGQDVGDLDGIMQPLPGKAKLDLALTIDIDLHNDGHIELLLASNGVLQEAQLANLGVLFETIVESAADDIATVGQFVAFSASAQVANHKSPPKYFQPAPAADKTFQACLASVCSTVCQLLHLDESTVRAANPETMSLYRLGLDSINVLPFVKVINKVEGVKVSPNAVIRARTLWGVAVLVHTSKCKSVGQIGHGTTITHQRVSGPQYGQILGEVADELLFVATPLQEGMLSASLALASHAYQYTHTMQLSEEACCLDAPDFARFFAAVHDTVQDCEILRTSFFFTDHPHAPWVGIVSPINQSNLVQWDVSGHGVVQLRIHHALYDAHSIKTLWRLLSENYATILAGRRGDRQQQRMGPYLYRPFAKQSAIAQEPAVAFWTNLVQDYDYSPAALVNQESPLHASSSFYFSLNEAELTTMQNRCREANVMLKAAMQLAWAKVLCESIYKQADVVFGEVISANGDDVDGAIMGPTINTIPLHVQLAHSSSAWTIAEALSQLQSLGDQARGPNGFASLRSVQTAWRSSRSDGVDTSVGLFQSLFVFDGVVGSGGTATDLILPFSPSPQNNTTGTGEKTPLYDDYPLIVSFRIRDNTLHGALRTKVGKVVTQRLGLQLATALRNVATKSLHCPALDPASGVSLDAAEKSDKRVGKNKHANSNSNGNGNGSGIRRSGSTELADAVLQMAKDVVGSRIRGEIGYTSKLVNIGLDSISAIRFSNMLKKKLGVHVSVFEIIRGASVENIVERLDLVETGNGDPVQQLQQQQSAVDQDEVLLKLSAADKLGRTPDEIKSVSPVLSGQRDTLQKWLHCGKRFFEAPWVYRIADGSPIDADRAADYWKALCHAHDILQTTFTCLGRNGSSDLVQVTLYESAATPTSRFAAVKDKTVSIRELIQDHVRERNSLPSDLREPPSHFSFLEAADGQTAIVLRLHHALYDAWSIKSILGDLSSLYAANPVPTRPTVRSAIQEMLKFREPAAEKAYWTQHLTSAEETIVSQNLSASIATAPLGPHFKVHFEDIVYPGASLSTTASTTSPRIKSRTSLAIITAYARALGWLTGTTNPTFGLNYSSRSLSSADDQQTLDLTGFAIPTMAVVPVSVDLTRSSVLGAVREHLAHLTKFAQADNLHELSPRYNTYINILFAGGGTENTERAGTSTDQKVQGVIQRHLLGEPLASEYFTKTTPLLTAYSTIDSLDRSALNNHQLYFNILVRQNGSIGVDVSGDEDVLYGRGPGFVDSFIARFGIELAKVVEVMEEN